MKKILLVLALLATVQFAFAQKAGDALKAIEKAELAAQNPKKAAKASTWLSLGEAYEKAYDIPAGNLYLGASQTEIPVLLKGQHPRGEEEVSINGEVFLKSIYADKDLYIDGAGQLVSVIVTKPVVEGALEKSIEAFRKAMELEPKRATEVSIAFQRIVGKYSNDALSYFNVGDYKNASEAFEKAANLSAGAPLEKPDTNLVYNAALSAVFIPDLDRAGKFYQECYKMGYYGESGDVFSKLSEISMQAGDTLKSKEYLEEGFTKFPQSQGILIGLINYYISSGEGTDRLFSLIDQAKANEPKNASLYYVEGNIHLQLGDMEKAAAAYDKCAEVNPSYEYGYIGKGIMYYNHAIEVQEVARDEFDDNKYNAMVKEIEAALRNCIEPFTKAFEVTKDESIKPVIAEYLKNAYFRFREESPEYMEAYEKFNRISKGE